MKRTRKILFLIVLLANIAKSQNPGYILTIPPDANSLALAGATQASYTNALSIFINPALLAVPKSFSFAISNIIEYKDYQYGAMGMVFPIKNYGTAGVGLAGISIPNIQQYDQFGSYVKDFNFYNMAILIGYAQQWLPLQFGVDLKYLLQGYSGLNDNPTGHGFGIDIGIHYIALPNFKIGIVYRWSFHLVWTGGYTETIPKTIDIGLNWQPRPFGWKWINLLWNLHQEKGAPVKLGLGFKLVPLLSGDDGTEHLVFYGGIGRINIETRTKQITLSEYAPLERTYTFGIGLRLGHKKSFLWGLDYCYWMHSILNDRHLLTIKTEF